MRTAPISLALRLVTAALMFWAIIWQVTDRVVNNVFRPTEYFEYFTIETGLISATVTLLGAIRILQKKKDTVRWLNTRLAVVSYEIVVGIIYNLLLRDDKPDPRDGSYAWPHLPNELLHVWAPILITIDFILSSSQIRLKLNRVWWILIFPFGWFLLMNLRGYLADGWFPYWFFDPAKSNITTIVEYFFGILIFMIVVGFGMLSLRNLIDKQLGRNAR